MSLFTTAYIAYIGSHSSFPKHPIWISNSLADDVLLVAVSQIILVNVYYVMGSRPNYFTCTAHLYLYYTLLVPHTYASYIRH